MTDGIELFSADRRGFYDRGTLRLTTDNPLPNPQGFLRSHRDDFEQSDLSGHVKELFPDGLSLHGWDYATRFYQPMIIDGKHLTETEPAIELVFEYVRRSYFPNRPSRFQSFYAFDDFERVKQFSPASIYLLSSESVFKADQAWLSISNQLAVASYNAHRYWSGDASAQPDWEYLLSAPVLVVKLVEPQRHE